MGYKAWQGVGRQVVTSGVRINARYSNDKDQEERSKTLLRQMEHKKKKRDFRKITVFDISHTKSVFEEERAPNVPTIRLDGPLDIEELEGEVSGV